MTESADTIEGAIAALQAQRALLGDGVVNLAIAPLQQRLAALREAGVEPPGNAAARPQQRRLTSVLFADIVGSTALTQHLDPEDVHAVMDGALARFTEKVQAHQGRVLQYAGDSLLAVFGADRAREDDAERAVRAALDVLAEGKVQGAAVQRRFGHDGFDVRVGVHTGPVLLGGGVDDEGSIRGMAVNVAARLEQAAAPGTLRISHDTWRLVAAHFEAQRHAPLQVKGRDEPLVSYSVLKQRLHSVPGGRLGVEGLRTPMMGRETECQQLHDRLAAAMTAPGVHGLLVEGEIGMGKTRLAETVLGNAAILALQTHPTLRVRGLPSGRQRSHGLLRDLLVSELGLDLTAPPEAVRAAFTASLLPAFAADGAAQAEAQAHWLGQLIGLDFSTSPHVQALREAGAALREQALNAGIRWLHRLARQAGSLLVCVDDAQALDDASLAFVCQLLRQPMPGASLTVLMLARPALRQRWPDTDAALERQPGSPNRLKLAPLAPAARALLASELLHRLTGPDAGLHNLLVERAEGNPFFMEELVQMWLDNGQLRVGEDGRWQVRPAPLRSAQVPTTLVGVLQARLDSLPPLERLALQQAAVAGPLFWDAALAAIDSRSTAAVPALVGRHLLRREQAEADEPGSPLRLGFAHPLMQEVVYDTVLRPQRRTWHARVAGWMSKMPPARRDEALTEIAVHFERGGQPAQALPWLLRAVQRDADRFAHDAVITAASHVLTLIDTASEQGLATAEAAGLRWQAHLNRQRSLRMLGRLAEQEVDLAALEALAAAGATADEQATIALRRAVVLLARGDAAGCAARCAAARKAARSAAAAETEVSVCTAWVSALRSLGQYDQALVVAQQGLDLARSAGLRGQESELLTAQAAMATDCGDPVRALALLHQSLAIDTAIGSRHTECAARINLGDALLRVCDFAAARSALEQGLALARAIGARGFESVALLNLSAAARATDQVADALTFAAQAHDQAVASANAEYQAFASIAMAHAALMGDDPAAALAAYAQARAQLEQLQLNHLAIEAVAGECQVALRSADRPTIARLSEQIGQHVARHGRGFEGTEQPLWVQATWCAALQHLGDARAAEEWRLADLALRQQTGRITDSAAAQRFATALPHHRAIHAAVAAGPQQTQAS